MTDEELIALLRDWNEYDEGKINDAREAAAARIEELKAVIDHQHKRAETLAEGWRIADDARIELEAKLAKAVEAERERIISMYRMLSTGSAVGAGDGRTFAVQYVDPDKLAAAIRKGGE